MSNLEKKQNQDIQKSPDKGEVLKAARVKQGLTLESVHETTKVPMDALRAIEEDYTIRTLSDFYYKSFLKIYAKFLNVDLSQLLENEKAQVVEPVVEEVKPVVVEFDIKDFLAKVFTRKRKQQLVILIGLFICFFLLFKTISFFMTRKPKEQKQNNVAVTSQSKVERNEGKALIKARVASQKKVPVKVQPKKEVKNRNVKPKEKKVVIPKEVPKMVVPLKTVVISTNEEQVSTPITKNVILTVRATKASWLRVVEDGKIVFQSTLRLGSVETWMADEKIEISGKNIGLLEFELNGKMIGTLGKAKRRIKNVVVTKDGLSVNK